MTKADPTRSEHSPRSAPAAAQRLGSGHRLQLAPPLVHEALKSPGQPLDAVTRRAMESRLGHDFSRIRVHSDARAGESARSVGALGYTVGQDVVLRDPRSGHEGGEGDRVLAHELAHAAQWEGSLVHAQEPLAIAPVDHPAEAEAGRVAGAHVEGRPEQVSQQAGGLLFRQPAPGTGSTGTVATPAAVVPQFESFAQMWARFEQLRQAGKDAEAIGLSSQMVGPMSGKEALDHGADLAIWLIQKNELETAKRALQALETAWLIEFVTIKGKVPPPQSGWGSKAGPETLMEEGEQQALSGNHAGAIELLGRAYFFFELQLAVMSEKRFKELAEMSGRDEKINEGLVMFRLLAYSQESGLIASMRRIVSFYSQLERTARAAGKTTEADDAAKHGRDLRALIRAKYLLTGTGEGSTVITMEATFKKDPKRGEGYVLHGDNAAEEFVTPLPGEPRPDELGKHPAYSAPMDEAFEAMAGQEDLLTELTSHKEVRDAFGKKPIDMTDRSARLTVWAKMYAVFQKQPAAGCPTALCSLMKLMERYLKVFTTHTEYNVRDFGVSYLDSQMPTDLLGRTLQDCGVYAVTMAYEVYQTARGATPKLPVEFQLYHTLEHAMLVIRDKETNTHYVVSNNQIEGPKSGDETATVTGVYSGLMQRPNVMSAGARTQSLSTDQSTASFKTDIWQKYQSGAKLALDDEPSRGPGDTRTRGERHEDAYKHYYEGMEKFDRLATITHSRLDGLVEKLAKLDAAGQGTAMNSELAAITATSVELIRFAENFVLSKKAVGLSPGATRPVEQVALTSPGLATGNHSIVRLGCALLFAESRGATLTADQQAILAWIRGAPWPGFGKGIADYEKAGKPAVF